MCLSSRHTSSTWTLEKVRGSVCGAICYRHSLLHRVQRLNHDKRLCAPRTVVAYSLCMYVCVCNTSVFVMFCTVLRIEDEVAEWLRRWTANPLCSARVGSNPILVVFFFQCLIYQYVIFMKGGFKYGLFFFIFYQ